MKNSKNTPACLANQSTKDMYRELIRQILIENNVKSIARVEGKDEPFFDRVDVTSDGRLEVYSHGLHEPMRNFFFDYTMDFARCLSYIEDEIFMQSRSGKSQHGYKVEFNA